MKLTQFKLAETLRRLADGKTVYQARKVARVSVRRVYQVNEALDKTEEVPDIEKLAGRPRKPFEEWEITIVKEAFAMLKHYDETREKLWARKRKYITLNAKLLKRLKEMKNKTGKPISRIIEDAISNI